MATLIQSKQIEGVVTASVVQGDFTVSGSILATDITASSISSSGPIYGVRYDDIQGTPNFIGGSGILITQVGDNITITNTGGGGGVSGSAELISSVAQLNSYTGSNDIIIVGLQSQINQLISQTGSYETKGRGIVSGSSQLTSSLDSRYALSGSVGGGGVSSWNDLTDIPSGLVSSSEQVLGGSGVLSGSHTDISSLNDFTSSIQSQVDALINATSSYLTSETDNQTLSIVGDQLTISGGNTVTIPTGSGGGTSDFTQLTNVPSGLVSSSEQITLAGVDGFSSYFTSVNNAQIAQDAKLTSLESFTASVETQFGEIETQLNDFSSSYLIDSASIDSRLTTLEGRQDLTGSDSQILSIVGDQLTISDGNTITIPTGSTGVSSWNDLTDIPSGILSASVDFNTYSASVQSTIDGIQHTQIPDGTISSSQQISDLGFVTSSLEAPFNGNRVVSNTLLGDLYTEGYNAGTSGSLAQFINQVFFPSAAPTATFTDQSAYFNTNLATDGTNLVSVSITDTVDDHPYTIVLSGTGASSLTAVPTNADSSSWEIRANGDLAAGVYLYDVVVSDINEASRTYSGRSITIAQADNGTLSTNGTLYIIESATSGVITLSSTGRPGSTGAVSVSYSPNYGTQVATNFSSSNPLISVNSTNGQLSVGSPISGSGNVNGDTIISTISWEDQYGNTDSQNITVNVTSNQAPSLSSTLITNNNTNQATGSAQIVRLTITDTEGDSIPNEGLVFTSYNSTYFTPVISSPYMYLNANNISIPAGNYSYQASLQDVHGFNTRYLSSNVVISQAGVGTLGGDTTSYIIESALSGSVLRDVTGYNAGNPSQLTVSYSPNYGSQVVQSYTSTNPDIVVDNSGYLTLAVDLSGSTTQSGDTLSTDITFQDQYGNVGSGSVTVNVFANNAPTITFVASSNYDDATATSGSDAGTITISDTESNTPFQVSLGGTDGGKFDISGSNSPYKVQPTGSLSAGTYTISITATDDYSKSTTVTNKTIVVDNSSVTGQVYVYDLGQYNSNVLFDLGVQSIDGSTPPIVTTYTGNGFLEKIEDGALGDSSISYNWGTPKTATLLASGGGSNLDSVLQGFGNISKPNSNRFAIIVPADLDMGGIPTSMANSYGGSTSGEYVLEVAVDGGAFGAGLGTIEDSTVYGVTLGSAVEGTTNYRVIVENNQVASATSIKLAVVPSSGSTPT